MSNQKTTYLILGAKMTESDLPGGRFDDRWLPHIEGHLGIEINILYGEGDNNIYVGKVLAETSAWDGDPVTVIPMGLSDEMVKVSTFLSGELGCHELPQLIFFNLWG